MHSLKQGEKSQQEENCMQYGYKRVNGEKYVVIYEFIDRKYLTICVETFTKYLICKNIKSVITKLASDIFQKIG